MVRGPSLLASGAVLALLATTATGARQRGPAPDPLVRENATIKVAPHTYIIPDGNVGLVPNVGIVVGSRATLVIDPGLGRRNGETVLKEVAKVSGNATLYIATTHFHPEHTTGYVAFPPSAKYIDAVAQEAEFEQNGMQMVRTFATRSAVTADLLKDAARRPADVTFDREYTLDLGDLRVRFMAVGPTHTRGDTGLFVEGDGVLFAGDVVMNQSFLAANDASSMAAWLKAFDTFDAVKPSTIVPSHGAVGPGGLITENRAVMMAIRARAVALKAQGKSIDEAVSTIQAEQTAAHPAWPRANGVAAAARSAYNEPQQP
jgi:glyoxylase-like metal-dependent hydrolase (beta-lactamase superfamily II)